MLGLFFLTNIISLVAFFMITKFNWHENVLFLLKVACAPKNQWNSNDQHPVQLTGVHKQALVCVMFQFLLVTRMSSPNLLHVDFVQR